MVLGLLLTEWDTQVGPLIKARFPNNFQVSKEELNKLLMSHSISKELKSEMMELRLKNTIILSYCPKELIPDSGYSMLIIVLDDQEAKLIDDTKNQLERIGEEIFHLSGFNQIKQFHHHASQFFQKKSSRKILFIGSSAVGKTSIKKMFFEAIPSETLLDRPLEPTYGLIQCNYDWLDLDLGVADLAGQEIEHFLNESFESEIDPFDSVDVILYIFDSTFWDTNSVDIVKHIQQIQNIQEERIPLSKLHIFCHKLDLIPDHEQNKFKNEVIYTLPASIHDRVYFTSIKLPLIHHLIRSMQIVIGTLSPQTKYLEEIIYETISDKQSTAIIILNQNRILLSASTKDFHLINYSHIFSFIHSINVILSDFQSDFIQMQMRGTQLKIAYSSLDWSSNEERIFIVSDTLSYKELTLLKESILYSLVYLETSYNDGDPENQPIKEGLHNERE